MFKESFKYYRSKNPRPDLEGVLDFRKIDELEKSCKIKKVNIKNVASKTMCGFIPTERWDVYELTEIPGLIFIKNPFTNIGQRYWTVKCLKDYSKKPNKSNLDSLKLVPEDKDWWDMCQNNNNNKLLNKLRWITLGYHHDWDTKVYTEENKTEFPKDLGDMTKYVANVMGYSNFIAEAAIVNYYHMDSTLCGHTDISENNLNAPLFSMSFGQTAIFLIGGKTLDKQPTAMFLRSGDIVIMSEESRLCYHGVPKILQVDSRCWDCLDQDNFHNSNREYKETFEICKDEDLWKPFGDYLTHSRINLNVRQVLCRGQKRLNCDKDDIT